MQVHTIRKPGQPGTEKLLTQYGDKLICVRYRYDYAKRKRYKTAEIIVAEADWDVTNKTAPRPRNLYEFDMPEARIVGVRIEYREHELREKIRSIGAWWDKKTSLWYAPEDKVQQIKLGDRIVKR